MTEGRITPPLRRPTHQTPDPDTPWWHHPHNPRTREQCTATLTTDPRTQCTRRTHPTTNNDPGSWHTWGAVTWGTATPDHMTRAAITTHHGTKPLTDHITAHLGDPHT